MAQAKERSMDSDDEKGAQHQKAYNSVFTPYRCSALLWTICKTQTGFWAIRCSAEVPSDSDNPDPAPKDIAPIWYIRCSAYGPNDVIVTSGMQRLFIYYLIPWVLSLWPSTYKHVRICRCCWTILCKISSPSAIFGPSGSALNYPGAVLSTLSYECLKRSKHPLVVFFLITDAVFIIFDCYHFFSSWFCLCRCCKMIFLYVYCFACVKPIDDRFYAFFQEQMAFGATITFWFEQGEDFVVEQIDSSRALRLKT